MRLRLSIDLHGITGDPTPIEIARENFYTENTQRCTLIG